MDSAVNIDLIWSSKYELGHSKIDTQHQQLFKLYSRVTEAFQQGKGNEYIHAAVDDLITYTRFHFKDEESLMARLGYPDLATHREEHNQLLMQVETFAEELKEGKPVLIYEVLGFVRDWIQSHILEEDVKLRQSLIEWN